MINARHACPLCGRDHRQADIEATATFSCECGWTQPAAAESIRDGVIERCPICSTTDLYLQKDFPERVGVALVVAGVVMATYFWAQRSWVGTIGALAFFGAIDWALYYTRRDVTVCYRCLAQFRNMAENPAHRTFDLGIGERYRQERLRKEALRQQRAPAPDRET